MSEEWQHPVCPAATLVTYDCLSRSTTCSGWIVSNLTFLDVIHNCKKTKNKYVASLTWQETAHSLQIGLSRNKLSLWFLKITACSKSLLSLVVHSWNLFIGTLHALCFRLNIFASLQWIVKHRVWQHRNLQLLLGPAVLLWQLSLHKVKG